MLVEVNTSASCNVHVYGVPVENQTHKQVSTFQRRFFQVVPEESGVSSSLLSSANGGIGVSNVLPSDRSNRYLPLYKKKHTQQKNNITSGETQ